MQTESIAVGVEAPELPPASTLPDLSILAVMPQHQLDELLEERALPLLRWVAAKREKKGKKIRRKINQAPVGRRRRQDRKYTRNPKPCKSGSYSVDADRLGGHGEGGLSDQ